MSLGCIYCEARIGDHDGKPSGNVLEQRNSTMMRFVWFREMEITCPERNHGEVQLYPCEWCVFLNGYTILANYRIMMMYGLLLSWHWEPGLTNSWAWERPGLILIARSAKIWAITVAIESHIPPSTPTTSFILAFPSLNVSRTQAHRSAFHQPKMNNQVAGIQWLRLAAVNLGYPCNRERWRQERCCISLEWWTVVLNFGYPFRCKSGSGASIGNLIFLFERRLIFLDGGKISQFERDFVMVTITVGHYWIYGIGYDSFY